MKNFKIEYIGEKLNIKPVSRKLYWCKIQATEFFTSGVIETDPWNEVFNYIIRQHRNNMQHIHKAIKDITHE